MEKIVRKGEIAFSLTLSQTSPVFTCLHYRSFENTVGKGEIAPNDNFTRQQNFRQA